MRSSETFYKSILTLRLFRLPPFVPVTRRHAATMCLVLCAGWVASADPAASHPSDFTVAVNANFAGCADLRVLDWSMTKDVVSVDIVLSGKSARDPNSLDVPCICRGGSYFVSVYPADEAAKDDTIWSTATRGFRRDLAVGPFKMRQARVHRETIGFPAGLLSGRRWKFYYLVLGCD